MRAIKLFSSSGKNNKGKHAKKSGSSSTAAPKRPQQSGGEARSAQRRPSAGQDGVRQAQRGAPEAGRRPQQPGARNNKAGKKKGVVSGKLVMTVIVSLAAVIFAGSAIAGNSVSKSDTIYPNISVDDVFVGGLTMAEAAEKLEEAGFSAFEGEELKINFPMDRSITITAEDVGMQADSSDAAIFAYEYGRDGNMFSNLISYLGCKFSPKELEFETEYTINEELVKQLVKDVARDVNAELMDGDLEIVEREYISLIKGAQSMSIDTDEVFELIDLAFKNREFSELDYEPEPNEEETLDVEGLYESIFVEPVDSEYDPETGGVTEHVEGISFDKAEALSLWDMTRHGEEVKIPLIVTDPEITSEHLKSVLFRDVLSAKTTNLTYNYARNNNITKACEAMNGVILNPGETFSYNGTVGQRTSAGGYMAAGAYSGNTSVSEIGGGICQTSSTLYYVALYANLEIVERYCHSMAVSYLPPGLDATVSWPNPDFKFKNDRDFPIKIEASTDLTNYTVSIKIIGTDVDGSYVVMRSDSWATATGTEAVTYRDVYDKDGVQISTREEARSRYSYADSSTPEPEESEEPSEEPTQSPDVTAPTEPTAPTEQTPEPPPVTEPVDPPPVTAPPEQETPPDPPAPDGGGEE